MSSKEMHIDDYLTEVVVPGAMQFDTGRVISELDSIAVAKYGLLDAIFSENEKYSLEVLVDAILKVSAKCGNLRNLFLVNYGMVGMLLKECSKLSPVFIAEYELLRKGMKIGALAMTEQSGGSNSKSFSSRVSRSNGGLVLNGTKTWITLGSVANFYFVQAWVEAELRIIYVPREAPGIIAQPIDGILGARGSGLATIQFNNVRVYEESILPSHLLGFNSLSSQDFILRNGRLFAGSSGLGMGIAALEHATKVLRQKKNNKGSLFFQGDWQMKISELYQTSVALMSLVRDVVANYSKYMTESQDKFTPLKILGTKFAMNSSELLLKATGAEGYKESSYSNRIWRESVAGEFIEGGNVVLTSKCSLDWLRIVLSGTVYDVF
jgi:alkylation response protein AidB-like acyl-CoA dehydrogenase